MKQTICKFIITIALWAGFTSCGNWLDIDPSDSVTDDKLSETGEGYRIKLNGVYAQMAEIGLYGANMTWGFADVLGIMYNPTRFASGESFHYAAKYNYKEFGVKAYIQSIWSDAYNSIANCNSIIQRIEDEPANKFLQKEEEKNLIWGEALALRAYLHFDLLRLFAPSTMNDDGKAHLPYVKVFPTVYEKYETNRDFLENTIDDLLKAKAMLAAYDTVDLNYLRTENRIEGYSAPVEDLFFYYRGYRMNYYAVCALLARVYNYAGMHREAYDEADIVINAKFSSSKLFNFTRSFNIDYYGNTKLYDEVIFCLSNSQLWNIYEPYYSGNTKLYLNGSKTNIFDDNSDSRSIPTIVSGSRFQSTKYIQNSGSKNQYNVDMIPMIRVGEMYLIQAEYWHAQNNDTEAINALDKLRTGHGCSAGRISGDFTDNLLKEARREFIGEGQLFYYHKKTNRLTSTMKSADQFILPHPDNEDI